MIISAKTWLLSLHFTAVEPYFPKFQSLSSRQMAFHINPKKDIYLKKKKTYSYTRKTRTLNEMLPK